MTDTEAIITDDGQIIDLKQIVGTIHISRPSIIQRTVELQRCPTCKKDQAFVIEIIAWYGQDATCLGCGERWNDGEMCPRPFARGWRRESIERAIKRLSRPLDPDPFKDMESDDENILWGEHWNPSKWLKTV